MFVKHQLQNISFGGTIGIWPVNLTIVKIPDPFPTQNWQRPVTTCVCKSEAANTV